MEFTEAEADHTVDVLAVITGLSFYKMKKYDKALDSLITTHNAEAAFYRCIINYEKAASSPNPDPLYEKAVSECNDALTKLREKPEPLPEHEAFTQNLLGLAHLRRSEIAVDDKSKKGHLGEAEKAFDAAQEIYEQEKLLQDVAMMQTNLGITYGNLGHWDKDDSRANGYLSKAYDACKKARSGLNKETFPLQWAMTQDCLGTVYLGLGKREKDNSKTIGYLQDAKNSYDASQKVYKQNNLPQDWATTQNNLGNALLALGERLGGEEGIKYLNKAVEAYNAALKVFTDGHYHKLTMQNKQEAQDALAKLQADQVSKAGNGGGGEAK